MRRVILLLAPLALACSSGPSPVDGSRVDRRKPLELAAGDAAVDTTGPLSDRAVLDLRFDRKPDSATPSPYKEARGVVHLHSIYSHDGCDSKGFTGGKPNTVCVGQLRAAVCARGFDFAALTDHPSNMASYTMQEDLLYDAAAGDQLVLDAGAPIANRITCPGGKQALLSVGFESTHTMPLGLHALPPGGPGGALYAGTTDASDPTTAKQQIQGLKAAGAVAALAHSEESDLSATTIAAAGFEAMEWYNIHASILALTGGDKLTFDAKNVPVLLALVNKLLTLGPFLSSGPHSDLVYLVLLDNLPPAGFSKWRKILATQKITGLLGSDIHQNVSVDSSTCAGAMQPVCSVALSVIENMISTTIPTPLRNLLLQGGNLLLSDGDRIDSYGRLMRWLENRVLVTSFDPLALQEGLRQGRAYGVFTVFGDPHAFSFTAQQGSATLQLGESATGALTLQLAVPDLPQAITGGAPFTPTEALKAEVRAQILHTDSVGTTVIHEETTLGAKVSKPVTAAGAYHVEIRVKPKHLTAALAASASLAGQEYLWLISNPIYIK